MTGTIHTLSNLEYGFGLLEVWVGGLFCYKRLLMGHVSATRFRMHIFIPEGCPRRFRPEDAEQRHQSVLDGASFQRIHLFMRAALLIVDNGALCGGLNSIDSI